MAARAMRAALRASRKFWCCPQRRFYERKQESPIYFQDYEDFIAQLVHAKWVYKENLETSTVPAMKRPIDDAFMRELVGAWSAPSTALL